MTITPISTKKSRVVPDDGKALKMPNDENLYSEIICVNRLVSKIEEVKV